MHSTGLVIILVARGGTDDYKDLMVFFFAFPFFSVFGIIMVLADYLADSI
jgi:hypothetical protein